MDERRTLQLIGYFVGTIVLGSFVLSAMAMA